MRDDTKIIGDGIAPDCPLARRSPGEEIVDGLGEEGEGRVEGVVGPRGA